MTLCLKKVCSVRQDFLCPLNLICENLFSILRARKGAFYSLNIDGDVCAILKHEELEGEHRAQDKSEG